jgi:predicted dehydrogenase
VPDRLRWGIIATGNIASCFAKDLRLLPDHDIAAVGSRNLERAQRFAAEFALHDNRPHAHGSYTGVIDDPTVDAIYVATPHSDHYATTRYALEAGKAVLCEKAFTVTAEQARDLVALARDKGVFLMEAMWMRTNPLHLKLREVVQSGAIGEVKHLHAELGFTPDYDPNDRLWAPELAGGALLDVGVYPISLAYHLLGSPQDIHATARLAPTGVDAAVTLQFTYANGASASLAGAFDTNLPNTAGVGGTEGWIDLPRSFHDTDRFTVRRPDAEPEEFAVELNGVGYTYEAEEVARCLRDDRIESSLVSLDDSLAVMDIVDVARRQIGVTYPDEVTFVMSDLS